MLWMFSSQGRGYMLRGAKISMRNNKTWIHFFLKSEYFGIFIDYLLLHTGFLIPVSQPWPYSKPCSYLLLAAEDTSAQWQEICTSWKNILWACNGCSTPTALLTTYEKWKSCVCAYGKILSTPQALPWKQKLTCRAKPTSQEIKMATFSSIPFTTQKEISYPAAKTSKDVGARKLHVTFWSQ